MPQFPETKEQLLPRLYELMEKSDDIRMLSGDRKKRIMDKYSRASLAAIKNGILMLESNIAEKDARREKARLGLKKSTEKLKELKQLDDAEKKESEKLADEMLKGLVPAKKPCICKYVLAVVLLGIAVYLAYLFLSR